MANLKQDAGRLCHAKTSIISTYMECNQIISLRILWQGLEFIKVSDQELIRSELVKPYEKQETISRKWKPSN